MRDLGAMGESIFSFLCSSVGLIANGSQIDKTGWDFMVEFPFLSGISTHEVHQSALECKVQIKATDKRDRKLQIKLSNLRRLVTAPLPVFFVFFEFDRGSQPENIFIVHLDNDLAAKILEKLYKLEQSEQENNLNKRTMTISYGEKERLSCMDGKSLKETFLKHIGGNLAEYISKKKKYLESVGFENGMSNFNFSITDAEDLKKLVDMSLGLDKYAKISDVYSVDQRFGISAKKPSLTLPEAQIAILNIKPRKSKIRFREDRFSTGLTFNVDFYDSPFNFTIPNEYRKFRIVSDFFDLKLNPYNGHANYSFCLGGDVVLELESFKAALKLMTWLGDPNKKLLVDFDFYNNKLDFVAKCKENSHNFMKALDIVNKALEVKSYFDVFDSVLISLEELLSSESSINELYCIFNKSINCEFEINNNIVDLNQKKTVFITLFSATIGSHVFGAIVAFVGEAKQDSDGEVSIYSNNMVVEKKIITKKGDIIPDNIILDAIKFVGEKYDSEYNVIMNCVNN